MKKSDYCDEARRGLAPTVGICTLGCRVNQYESRAIAEALQNKGFVLRDFSDACDIYVINTCAVTSESERKSRQMARRAHKRNPSAAIFVTGCQAQLHPEDAASLPGVRYVGGNASKLEIADIVDVAVKSTEKTIVATRDISAEYESYSVASPDHTRAYIKIEDGCENRCAYCVIPKVRGPVRSKPFDEVLSEVLAVSALGYKEIVLTGIEVCDYQYDLCRLIDALTKTEGIERLRLASVNPAFISSEFADRVKDNPRFCPHFHLSLQSGCDRTLRAMRRQYNTKMLKRNVSYLRSVMPDIAFTADIICGFPGETEEDFDETLKTVEEIGLIHAHIFPYSPRPETEAAKMSDQVPEYVKNQRCEQLYELCKRTRTEIIRGFLERKKTFSVLFEESRDGFSYGHTENFIDVALKTVAPLDGEVKRIRLLGELTPNGPWECVLAEQASEI